MHVPPLFLDVIWILLLSVAVILAFARFRLPSIIGFLVTGMLAGPYALGLVTARAEVELLAELGVILLMFTIGLEFSLKNLARIQRAVFLGGGLQVGLSVLITAVLARLAGVAWPQAVFLGFLMSLSSTAIVLKLLQTRLEMEALHGQVILAILIFQDLIVVPMMLVTPLLRGAQGSDVLWQLLLLLGKMALVLVAVLAGARYIMPRLLFWVAQTRSKELFLLTIIGTCLGVAGGTAALGLSLALGAFLAGLIISESEYSLEAVGNIIPFREIFASFFFVSIGMLLDLGFLRAHPLPILGLTAAVITLKVLLAGVAALFLRLPFRMVLLVALALAQVGEFAFILSRTGLTAGVLDEVTAQYFLAVSVLTMCLTPVLFAFSDRLPERLMYAQLPGRFQPARNPAPATEVSQPHLQDHLVVIGYGLNGRNVVKAAQHAHIPYVILETNPHTVRQERRKGEPILYGDAVQEHVLEEAHVAEARVIVIAISDPASTRRAILAMRRLNPDARLIVRTRYQREAEDLYRLGATEVIPEEFETSIEISSRMLNHYLVPQPEIERLAWQMRNGHLPTGTSRPTTA